MTLIYTYPSNMYRKLPFSIYVMACMYRKSLFCRYECLSKWPLLKKSAEILITEVLIKSMHTVTKNTTGRYVSIYRADKPILSATEGRGTETGMSFPTVGKVMQTLTGLGIARELTGQRRNRVFVYDAYLNILNEGGEAL